jgi:hypothetical protein
MRTADIAAIIWLAILIAAGYGWVMNIITLAHSNFDPITGLLVLRVIGIFVAPVGTILGYIA